MYKIGDENFYIELYTSKDIVEYFDHVETNPYGNLYYYYQNGAVDGLPEFFIPKKAFEMLCDEVGLKCVLDCNFEEFLTKENPLGDEKSLTSLQRKVGLQKNLSQSHRSLVGLYKAVVLKKTLKRKNESSEEFLVAQI